MSLESSGDGRYTLSIPDPSRWPDVDIVVVDAAGHFDVVISYWYCADGVIYPPAELAAGAGWRDMLAELFLRRLKELENE